MTQNVFKEIISRENLYLNQLGLHYSIATPGRMTFWVHIFLISHARIQTLYKVGTTEKSIVVHLPTKNAMNTMIHSTVFFFYILHKHPAFLQNQQL